MKSLPFLGALLRHVVGKFVYMLPVVCVVVVLVFECATPMPQPTPTPTHKHTCTIGINFFICKSQV